MCSIKIVLRLCQDYGNARAGELLFPENVLSYVLWPSRMMLNYAAALRLYEIRKQFVILFRRETISTRLLQFESVLPRCSDETAKEEAKVLQGDAVKEHEAVMHQSR